MSKVNLKRVAIAVQEFNSDPPQQLPSRKPKRGNVLIPEDTLLEKFTIFTPSTLQKRIKLFSRRYQQKLR